VKTFRIAVIAGDGIGKEVVPEGIRALDAAGRRFGFHFHWHQFDWSCEEYLRTGRMMPADSLQQLRSFDASLSALSGVLMFPTTFPCGVCSSPFAADFVNT